MNGIKAGTHVGGYTGFSIDISSAACIGNNKAADGNNNTYWQAAAGDASPWWMLDTEKGLALHHINVRFPQPDRYRYVVEISIDNKEWTMIMDKQNASNSEQAVDIRFKADEEPIFARYLRIRFVKDSPATIAEVKVSGIVQ